MGGGNKFCAWLLANCEVQLCSALAAMSILGVVVVCPTMLDPALETLASSYDNAQCQTLYSKTFRGMSSCSWTSCREGCTADIFTCWHILVAYVKDDDVNIVGNVTQVPQVRVASESLKLDTPPVHENGTTAPGLGMTLALPKLAALRRPRTTIEPPDPDAHKRVRLPRSLFDYVTGCFTDRNITRLEVLLVEMNWCLGNYSEKYNKNLSSLFSGFGALFPNQQKCIYPSEANCEDYYGLYGKVGRFPSFECLVSTSNASMIVTNVDKAAAIRNIFYCFIPLFMAGGVFTYLFYRVGLIGGGRQKVRDDEESSSTAESAKPQHLKPTLPNPPKKVRKKFLPKRKDSSKKRKKKTFKKNATALKNTLSIKSASSSRRTPSFSMGEASLDGRRGTLTKK